MPDDHGIHQPRSVSEVVSSYLAMTSARTHRPTRSRGSEAQKPTRRRSLIDNEGLGLHEGNDFA